MNHSSCLLVLLAVTPLFGGATTSSPHDPVGCYVATPPFRPADLASANDTVRAMLAIEPNSVLRGPQLGSHARIRGAWTMRGDSLHAWYSDGFSGWRYRLGVTPTGWQGVAEFLTDEFIPGDTAGPHRRPAVWLRRACP